MFRKLSFIVFIYLIGWNCLSAMPAPQAHAKYQLSKVLVLSRHNIRSPVAGNDSELARMTTHPWFKWTSGTSELSLLGGQLETLMGQYFRKWLVSEGFMQENERPAKHQMRFYANSKQRTIATTQYFFSGMLPVANMRIEYRAAFDQMDPVFTPGITFSSEAFNRQAFEQIDEMGGEKGIQGIEESLAPGYQLVEDTLDFSASPLAKEQQMPHFRTGDWQIRFTKGEEPFLSGSLKLAMKAADALILQYYEQPDDEKATWGKHLTTEQWEKVAYVKDMYVDVLVTPPSLAVHVAHPLLKEMYKEMNNKHRKFTFLCGHDSNLASVLAALQAVPYELPNAIEKKTPIGSKLVITKWVDKDGTEYASLDLIYQSVQQLRERQTLSLDNPPQVFNLQLKGLISNADGLYKWSDVQERFEKAIAAYKQLPRD